MSLQRLFGIWLAIAAVMIGNGIFRELVLSPAYGATTAGIMSVVLGTAIILIATRYFLRPLRGQPTKELVMASAVLVALTIAFEFLFGHYVDRKSWEELIGNYAIWRGRLWPVALLTLALTPFLWGRWLPDQRRGPRRRADAIKEGAL